MTTDSPMETLETVTSTMDVARANVVEGRVRFDESGRAFPTGVMARRQTQGRGQRGRHWHSEPDENLNATYYVACGETVSEIVGKLSLWAGVVIAEVLDTSVNGACKVGLKWPNDLLINGKKAGGILIEMVKSPREGWIALVGVGINVSTRNLPEELRETSTSLVREGLAAPSWRELGDAIGRRFRDAAAILPAVQLKEIVKQWQERDETAGRIYEAREQGEVIRGTATGVDESGALRLQRDDGTILLVTSASTITERSQDA